MDLGFPQVNHLPSLQQIHRLVQENLRHNLQRRCDRKRVRINNRSPQLPGPRRPLCQPLPQQTQRTSSESQKVSSSTGKNPPPMHRRSSSNDFLHQKGPRRNKHESNSIPQTHSCLLVRLVSCRNRRVQSRRFCLALGDPFGSTIPCFQQSARTRGSSDNSLGRHLSKSTTKRRLRPFDDRQHHKRRLAEKIKLQRRKRLNSSLRSHTSSSRTRKSVHGSGD